MTSVIHVTDSFVNIRAPLKIGVLDVGTHISLVRRKNGKWLMLDAVKLEPDAKQEVDKLTANGDNLEAILNLHPFHTLFCKWAHEHYPAAALYGSSRHVKKCPDLPWKPELLDDENTLQKWAEDLDLRIPKGVDFISSNEQVHFSSVVAFHPASKTIHVDDTFSFFPMPKAAIILFIRQGVVSLHPTLCWALQSRAGAAQEFRDWMEKMLKDWDVKNLLCAHSGALLESENTGASINDRLASALAYSGATLFGHRLRYGKAPKPEKSDTAVQNDPATSASAANPE